jgi:hypothetical protein
MRVNKFFDSDQKVLGSALLPACLFYGMVQLAFTRNGTKKKFRLG